MLYGNFDLKVSVLAHNSVIKGNLVFDTLTRIDGTVQGNIQAKAKLLISKTAKVEADIKAKELLLSGHLVGNVVAETFVVKAGAVFSGSVKAKDFVVEDGAKVNITGTVK